MCIKFYVMIVFSLYWCKSILSLEVSGTMSIYNYIYIYIYIYVNNMADIQVVTGPAGIFLLTCVFAPVFVSKEPLRPKQLVSKSVTKI